MAKFKLIAISVLAVIAVILILQNREPMETHLLFVTLTMSRATLLLLTLLLGFACGVLAAYRVEKKKHGKNEGHSANRKL